MLIIKLPIMNDIGKNDEEKKVYFLEDLKILQINR